MIIFVIQMPFIFVFMAFLLGSKVGIWYLFPLPFSFCFSLAT